MFYPLTPGITAPAFQLPDQAGHIHRLADYRGRWLLLYFYPKDGTPGCTRQACALRDQDAELQALGVAIVGISADTPARHARFAAQHGLPFTLLSDHTFATAERYGALWSWGPIRFTRRHTFLIDPQGQIVRIYRRVRVTQHAAEILRDLHDLMQLPSSNTHA